MGASRKFLDFLKLLGVRAERLNKGKRCFARVGRTVAGLAGAAIRPCATFALVTEPFAWGIAKPYCKIEPLQDLVPENNIELKTMYI